MLRRASHRATTSQPGFNDLDSVKKAVLVYGVRGSGKCGGAAPTFAAVRGSLPHSNLVTYSDGGTGTRNSCGGAVNVRLIRATGKAAGSDALRFSGDMFNISVSN